MEHVELMRVHTSGTDLVLRTPSGEEFLLAMDEALKRSVRMPQPRATAQQAPADTPAPLSPRQIQARIRAGESAAQVAAESGTDVEHVLRYEGPVLAEREYIASLARDIEVSAPLGHEGYRAAFGDEPATLGEMVHIRLRAFGVDPDTLTWDAWKLDSGTWRVVARFRLPEGSADLGEEPPAEWTFHPGRKHLLNANRWGQVLSEWEPWDVLPSQRKLVPVAPHTEEEETLPEPVAAVPSAHEVSTPFSPASPQEPQEPQDDLLEVLARRRGTRSGEEPEDDAVLARILDRSRQETQESREEDPPALWEPSPRQETRADGREEPEVPASGWPPLRRVPDPASHEEDEHARSAKKRRSQVPSWDEIVFGRSARGDDDHDD